MNNRTIIEFCFATMWRIIKPWVYRHQPQPSASVGNGNFELDNSSYRGQPHSIIVNLVIWIDTRRRYGGFETELSTCACDFMFTPFCRKQCEVQIVLTQLVACCSVITSSYSPRICQLIVKYTSILSLVVIVVGVTFDNYQCHCSDYNLHKQHCCLVRNRKL
jgi:hypothetical protein